MPINSFSDFDNVHSVDNTVNTEEVFTVPLTEAMSIKKLFFKVDAKRVSGAISDGSIQLAYSINNIDWTSSVTFNVSQDSYLERLAFDDSDVDLSSTSTIYLRVSHTNANDAVDFTNVEAHFWTIDNWDEQINFEQLLEFDTNNYQDGVPGTLLLPSGETNQGGGEEDPTSTNIISGNIEKLNLPFAAKVVVVSVGINPQVLGDTISDSVTGDYSIDVYPHTEEVLIYVAPDYGKNFISQLSVIDGEYIHPTIPNQYVYRVSGNGQLGLSEPTWPISGQIQSGDVQLVAEPLYRPLMNGFVKPVITPI